MLPLILAAHVESPDTPGKGGSDDASVGHPFDAALMSPLCEPNAVAMAD